MGLGYLGPHMLAVYQAAAAWNTNRLPLYILQGVELLLVGREHMGNWTRPRPYLVIKGLPHNKQGMILTPPESGAGEEPGQGI